MTRIYICDSTNIDQESINNALKDVSVDDVKDMLQACQSANTYFSKKYIRMVYVQNCNGTFEIYLEKQYWIQIFFREDRSEQSLGLVKSLLKKCNSVDTVDGSTQDTDDNYSDYIAQERKYIRLKEFNLTKTTPQEIVATSTTVETNSNANSNTTAGTNPILIANPQKPEVATPQEIVATNKIEKITLSNIRYPNGDYVDAIKCYDKIDGCKCFHAQLNGQTVIVKLQDDIRYTRIYTTYNQSLNKSTIAKKGITGCYYLSHTNQSNILRPLYVMVQKIPLDMLEKLNQDISASMHYFHNQLKTLVPIDQLQTWIDNQDKSNGFFCVTHTILPFVEGEAVDVVIAQNNSKNCPEDYQNIANGICENLLQLLNDCWIHGDIKPGNMIYNRTTKNLTFIDTDSITQLSSPNSTGISDIKQWVNICGGRNIAYTPLYARNDVESGGLEHDIFSVGVVLIQISMAKHNEVDIFNNITDALQDIQLMLHFRDNSDIPQKIKQDPIFQAGIKCLEFAINHNRCTIQEECIAFITRMRDII